MENTEEELVTTLKETEEEIETTPYDDIIDLALVSIEDYQDRITPPLLDREPTTDLHHFKLQKLLKESEHYKKIHFRDDTCLSQ